MQQKDIERFLLIGIKSGIYVALLTPLVLGPFGINLVEWPKAVFFRTVIEIVFAFYICLLLFNQKYLPKKSFLLSAIFLFYAILFAESIFGINFYRSFFGGMQRGEGLIIHLHLIAFFIIMTGVFSKREEWLNLLKMSVLVSAVSSFAAILQQLKIYSFYNMFDSASRLSGTMSNPDLFACYIVLSIFVAIFLLASEKNKNLKILWLSLIFLNCYTLFFSGTRASWGGLGLGIIFLFIFNFSYLDYKKRIIALFAILAFCAFMLLVFINPPLVEKLPGGHLIERIVDINLGGRIEIWTPAVSAIKEKPLFGWGFESFAFISDKYISTDPSAGNQYNSRGTYFDRPHNKVLEVLVYSGILGFLAYLLIFAVIFYLIFKYVKLWDGYNNRPNNRPKSVYGLILASFFIVYFSQNIFAFDNIGTYIFFFLVAGFINNNYSKPIEITQEKEPSGSSKYNPKFSFKIIFGFFIFLFTLWIVYEVNLKPTVAAMYFPASIKYEETDGQRAFNGYKRGIGMNTFYDSDLILAFTERTLYLLESNMVKDIEQQAISKLLEIRPVLYKSIENKDEQINHMYSFIARIDEQQYILTKDTGSLARMEEILNEAILFNPTVTDFYKLMGEAKIFQGNYSEGQLYIEKSCVPGICNKAEMYQRIGIAYLKAEDYKKSLENFQKVLDIDYDSRKQKSESAINFINPGQFTDNVAIMYYSVFNDLQSCKKVYEKGMEVYPEYLNIFKQHLDAITSDYNSKNKQ